MPIKLTDKDPSNTTYVFGVVEWDTSIDGMCEPEFFYTYEKAYRFILQQCNEPKQIWLCKVNGDRLYTEEDGSLNYDDFNDTLLSYEVICEKV